MLSDKAISFSQQYGTYMQILEPFIWTYGDAQSVMISSLLLILLFADMPFVTEATAYWLVRTNRRIWLIGLLYVVLATLIYTVFQLIVQCILAAPRSFIGNIWSDTGAMIGYSGIGQEIALPASLKTMEMSSPYRCAITIFLLMLLYSLFIASILLLLNLYRNMAVGALAAFTVNLYGFFLSPEIIRYLLGFMGYQVNVLTGWLLPLNHATYYMHNFGYDYLPKIWMSVIVFAFVITLFLKCAEKKIRTYDFSFIRTDI